MKDFIGFTFNGIHSSDLGIIRVSGGDRYNETLLPEFEDKTAEIVGGDGSYYFGSFFKNKSIKINVAFDHLTEQQFKEIRRIFSGKGIYPLIFDEKPYKEYRVRLASAPEIEYVCFDEKKKTINMQGEDGIRYIRTASQTAEVSSGIDSLVLNESIFLDMVEQDGEYEFIYVTNSWTLNEEAVDLEEYGIEYTDTIEDGSTFVVTVETVYSQERETIYPYIVSSETERIYKGEMEIEFVAYFPFARAPYKECDNEFYTTYGNINEWLNSANLLSSNELIEYDWGGGPQYHNYDYNLHATAIRVFNPGDIPTPVGILTGFQQVGESTSGRIPELSFTLIDSNGAELNSLHINQIVKDNIFNENSASNYGYFVNSKNHLIEEVSNINLASNANFTKTSNIYNEKIKSGDFFSIPANFTGKIICKNESDGTQQNPDPSPGRWYRIVYDYLYY